MSTLTFSKVVEDAAAAFALVLDRELTGHAVLTPQDVLLLDTEGTGVVVFETGVPTHIHHTGTDGGGAAALADLANPGPLRVECYANDSGGVPRTERYAVGPGTPAKRLAGDEELAERTRSAAGVGEARNESTDNLDAVEAFLADEEKVQAIRERAREEAARRATEWGFGDG